jgi:short-subunit dehydrogenase
VKVIRGKKALVTGAASGIGRMIALALAREGADLYLLDINEDELAKVAADARALGVMAITAHCDVTHPDEVSLSVEDLLARWGKVDILINNVGVAFYGPTERMTASQWSWLLKINLLAPIQFTRELLPKMLELPEAHIVNVCSIAGLVAGGRFAAYHVSKFGLVGFSEALRAEYGRRGVGVTALCPGPVQTNLYSSAISGREDREVPTPPAWICTTEQKVAERAIAAIRKNRRMVLLTPMAHLLWNLKRFAPGLLDFANHFGRKRMRRSAAADTQVEQSFAPREEQRRAA